MRLERGPIKVCGMLRKHLEADEVGVLLADESAFDEDVFLLEHQLAETVQVERPSHAHKQL